MWSGGVTPEREVYLGLVRAKCPLTGDGSGEDHPARSLIDLDKEVV